MPSRSWLVAVALLTAALGACAGAPTVLPTSVTASYTPRILDYAGSKGGMLTEVVGNPFQASKEELEAVIVETMARSHFGQKIPFFVEPPEAFTSPYRVVVAFDPAPGTSTYGLCAGTVQSRLRAPTEPTRVAAALCARELMITSTRGSIAGPTGPRDPGFVRLIGQISMALFPPVDLERRGARDGFDM